MEGVGRIAIVTDSSGAAVGLMTRSMRADLGVMISASHNPAEDNGIKFFSALGSKLDDETEQAIEELLQRRIETRKPLAPMLEGIDTLMFDIQDIGTRFYTYISTLGLAMQAAAGFRLQNQVHP